MSLDKKKKKFDSYHLIIWAAAAAFYFLVVFRAARIIALEAEALAVNLFKMHEISGVFAPWAVFFARYGAAPLSIIVIASIIYRLAGRRISQGNPLRNQSSVAKVVLGFITLSFFAAFCIPFAYAMAIWFAVEAFWWIEWYQGIRPTMDAILFTSPYFIAPVFALFGLVLVRFCFAAKKEKSDRRKPVIAFFGFFFKTAAALIVLATILLTAGAGLHLSRIGAAPGLGTFENKCGQCHARSRPLFFVKTPAEWKRTITRMKEFEKAPINEKETEKIIQFVTGMRSFSDKWTFNTRCLGCHVSDYSDWEKRTPEDWATIVDRIAQWSPYYYRKEVKDQVVNHLSQTTSKKGATLGLDRERYESYRKVGTTCTACHSLSRAKEKYGQKSLEEVAKLVDRMNDKMPNPIMPFEISFYTQMYKDLISDEKLLKKLFPHDMPVNGNRVGSAIETGAAGLATALHGFGWGEFGKYAGLDADADAPRDEAGGGRQVVAQRTLEPFTWHAVIKDFSPGLYAEPGGEWSFDYDLEVDLRKYESKFGKFSHLIVAVQGDWRHDREGFYRNGPSTFAVSSNFTVTGEPIERFDGWPRLKLLHGKDGSPFEGVQTFELDENNPAQKYRFRNTMTVRIPYDAPVGYYEPNFYVLVKVEGVSLPVHLAQYGSEWNESSFSALPLVKVGRPKAPKLPWTILSKYKISGNSGILPEEQQDRTRIIHRAGFLNELILPPGRYEIEPGFPTVFPKGHIAPLDGGLEVVPVRLVNYLTSGSGQAACTIDGPVGKANLGSKRFKGIGEIGPLLENGPFVADMTQTGPYAIRLTGTISDAFGRNFQGGGTYAVTIANPLTFSTSCKPGTSFLVGNGYPAKVNINPPFPAEVEVLVDYYPNSDATRKRTWVATGRANRFGHFATHEKPIFFDEPGEYHSTVTARYVDAKGRLWMNQQTSIGVIAPQKPTINLHGTRSFPYSNKMDQINHGAVKQFADRQDLTTSFMPFTPSMLPDPYAPYNPGDTLFIPSNGFNESLVEPHLSMEVKDSFLAARLTEAYREPSFMAPAPHQPETDPWIYMKDIVQISTDSFSWFPINSGRTDELPVLPAGEDGLHPFAFPQNKTFDAYTIMGVVRPGFPVMTSVYQTDAIGLYWLASPNHFGNHFNTGINGDLPGDAYRIQAGAVVMDLENGRNYYDAYASAIVVIPSDGTATAILPPGEQVLVTRLGRDFKLFFALDSHDAYEVGEIMAFGGMVFPNVEADVTWLVTKPSGEEVLVSGKANRLGLCRGSPGVLADEPGIYYVRLSAKWKDLEGDLVGSKDGVYWHCAAPRDNSPLLTTSLPAVYEMNAEKGVRVLLSWPEILQNVKLHWAVLMPGQVLDQGMINPEKAEWDYPFEPVQFVAQFPNLDVRNFSTGEWELADTILLQFFLEGELNEEKVYDSLRLVLRRDVLYNYRLLLRNHH